MIILSVGDAPLKHGCVQISRIPSCLMPRRMLGLCSKNPLIACLACGSKPAAETPTTAEEEVALAERVCPPLKINFSTPSASRIF